MQINPRFSRAVDLVKAFEAFEPRAVRRADGGWAIGYGHTRTAREGATVTRADAEALLIYDLAQVAAVVEQDVQVPLNANELGALAAFAFNIGWERFRRSSVVARLNAGDVLGAAEEMERWRRANVDGRSEVVDALVRRRAAEKIRFLTPLEGFPRTASPVLRPDYDAGVLPIPVATPPTAPLAEPALLAQPARLAEPAPPPVEPESPPPPPFLQEAAVVAFTPPAPANESLAQPRAEAVEAEPPPPVIHPDPEIEAPPVMTAEPSRPAEASRAPVSRRLVAIVLGIVGLVLFAASVDLILSGKPGGANLAIGLAGVLCMTPAAYILLGERPVGSERA